MKKIMVTISMFTLSAFSAYAANDNVPATGARIPGEAPAVTETAQVNTDVSTNHSTSANPEGSSGTSSLSTSGDAGTSSTLSGGANPSGTLGGPPNNGGTYTGPSSTPGSGNSSTPHGESSTPNGSASGSAGVSGNTSR